RIDREGLRPVWISLVPREQALARARTLADGGRAKYPLLGIPFAVKDNIDVAGMVTTAACPAFAYTASESATVVERLEQAGAILIGKTNMDQFATGLVGTRSPYGACSSAFDAHSISGGSSSGSAVAVASGLVSFALGTDTAGSGRVPAMFNNLLGLKPTRGVLSTHGVVPACRTLDCVSIFSETAHDAALVLEVAQGYDPRDAYSRRPATGDGAAPWSGVTGSDTRSFRFGVPRQSDLEFYGDEQNPAMYAAAVEALREVGGEAVEFDFAPFVEVAQLLYRGPWVAERYTVVEALMESGAELDASVATIIGKARGISAADAFRGAYALEELRTKVRPLWDQLDLLLLPTAPRTYTHAEIAEAPIERNSHLGHYTNFVNLLDMAAVALPAGRRPDGLPFGVSLIGQAFTERALLPLADALHRQLATTLGGSHRRLSETPALVPSQPPHGCLLMAVVGAHLSGQALNWQLTDRGGRLIRRCRTSANYRFFALKGTVPAKPGLVRVPGFAGPGIEVEVWALPADTVGTFVDGVPPPLAIGTLVLEDGSLVKGFLAEPEAVEDAIDITSFGGWRAYLESQRTIASAAG
ncbi:MAG: allophanate hydrolase, partial [Acidobacteriaceae bacterium]|nr:allophanate hydrolase [Acidobacteriaceae bacterium]